MKVRELRAEETDDGKRDLNGYAALYNLLSEDLPSLIRLMAAGKSNSYSRRFSNFRAKSTSETPIAAQTCRSSSRSSRRAPDS